MNSLVDIKIVIFLLFLAGIGIFSPEASFAQDSCTGTYTCCAAYDTYGNCIGGETAPLVCSGSSEFSCKFDDADRNCEQLYGTGVETNNCNWGPTGCVYDFQCGPQTCTTGSPQCAPGNCSFGQTCEFIGPGACGCVDTPLTPTPSGGEPYCDISNLIFCEFACVPDENGGFCVEFSGDTPYCSDSKKIACLTRFKKPYGCFPTLEGGQCNSLTNTEVDCIDECLAAELPVESCYDSICDAYRGGPVYCLPLMLNTCLRYRTPHVCQPDSYGGHCTPTNSQLKENGESCESRSECRSRKCDTSSSGQKYCVSSQVCEPGEFYPRDPYKEHSCSWNCSGDGREWTKNLRDCTPLSEINRYCQGNSIFYNNLETGETFTLQCDGECAYGVCVADQGLSCQPGSKRYIEGTCSGISGCPSSQEQYSGNCMAVCSETGSWEVAAGCGKIDISSDFSNAERFEILSAASNLDDALFGGAPLLFKREFSDNLEVSFIVNLRLNLRGYDSTVNRCAMTSYDNFGEDASTEISVSNCGTYESLYTHELTHYIAHVFPETQENFNVAIGCESHILSSERYTFENEQPVNDYAATNCKEAMSDAVEEYQSAPCPMKDNYPIQYDWMKEKFFDGKELCEESSTSYVPDDPKKENNIYPLACIIDKPRSEEDILSNKILAKVKNWIADRFQVSAADFVPHTYQFQIGSNKNEVIAQLGSAGEVNLSNGFETHVYVSGDVSQPNVYTFDEGDLLIYYRETPESLKAEYKNFDGWESIFHNPESIVASNIQRLSYRFIYPREGFTIVIDSQSGDVIQYESFLSIYLEEYLDTWGIEIDKTLVEYPTNTIEGDIDRDGDVDIDDYSIILIEFGNNIVSVADTDTDGDVDIYDYNKLVENF